MRWGLSTSCLARSLRQPPVRERLLFAPSEANNHEPAAEKHKETVDHRGHRDGGTVENSQSDGQCERSILDAALDGNSDALRLREATKSGNEKSPEHSQNVQRYRGGAGEEKLLSQAFFAQHCYRDDESEEYHRDNICRSSHRLGEAWSKPANAHSERNRQDGNHEELGECFPEWQLDRVGAAEKTCHRETDDPRDRKHGDNARHGRQCDRERGVATRQMRDEIRCRPTRTGGEKHEADCQLARQSKNENHSKGNQWQENKLAGEPNQLGPGRHQHPLEIRRRQAQSHAKKHRNQREGQ